MGKTFQTVLQCQIYSASFSVHHSTLSEILRRWQDTPHQLASRQLRDHWYNHGKVVCW